MTTLVTCSRCLAWTALVALAGCGSGSEQAITEVSPRVIWLTASSVPADGGLINKEFALNLLPFTDDSSCPTVQVYPQIEVMRMDSSEKATKFRHQKPTELQQRATEGVNFIKKNLFGAGATFPEVVNQAYADITMSPLQSELTKPGDAAVVTVDDVRRKIANLVGSTSVTAGENSDFHLLLRSPVSGARDIESALARVVRGDAAKQKNYAVLEHGAPKLQSAMASAICDSSKRLKKIVPTFVVIDLGDGFVTKVEPPVAEIVAPTASPAPARQPITVPSKPRPPIVRPPPSPAPSNVLPPRAVERSIVTAPRSTCTTNLDALEAKVASFAQADGGARASTKLAILSFYRANQAVCTVAEMGRFRYLCQRVSAASSEFECPSMR